MVKEYCSFLTREDCIRQQGPMAACDKVRPSLLAIQYCTVQCCTDNCTVLYCTKGFYA